MFGRLQKWIKKRVIKVLSNPSHFVSMKERKGESKRAGKKENKPLHKLQFIFCIKNVLLNNPVSKVKY